MAKTPTNSLYRLVVAAFVLMALAGCEGLATDLSDYEYTLPDAGPVDDVQTNDPDTGEPEEPDTGEPEEPDTEEPEENSCGGTSELEAEPLDPCGPCNEGEYICASPNSLSCSGASDTNDCGGCAPLDATPGTECDEGIWQCDGIDDVVCMEFNACDGVEPLDGEPGQECDGGDGTWQCDGTDDVVCVEFNDCGGTAELDAMPGEDCEDGTGKWECDGNDDVVCMPVIDESSRLQHNDDRCDGDTSNCSLHATADDQITLSVTLKEDDETPIADAEISFEANPVDGADEAAVADNFVSTDEEGVANTELAVGSKPGYVVITAGVEAQPAIDSITFTVFIEPPKGSYLIDFEHHGMSQPERVRPVLLPPETNCEDAYEVFETDGSWPTAEYILEASDVNPDGSIPTVTSPGFTESDGFTVVATGFNEYPNAEVEVAHGCNEAVPIENGDDVELTVALRDHLPQLGERYETFQSLEITDPPPAPVVTVLELAETLATTSYQFLVSDLDDDVTSLLDDIIIDVADGELKDNIEAIVDNQLAAAAVQDYFSSEVVPLMFDPVPDTVGSQLLDALHTFSTHGNFYFYDQPEATINDQGETSGEISAKNTLHRWDTVVFEWSLGCDPADPDYEDCIRESVGTDELGPFQNEIVDGNFDATITGADSIEFGHHLLPLHYGALTTRGFERLALKRLFGITTFDEMFDVLIDCQTLASYVEEEEGSALADAAEQMCEELSYEATRLVHTWVDKELGTDDEHFAVQTPDGSRCSLHQPDNYGSDWVGAPRPYIDRLGVKNQPMECPWELDVSFSDSNAVDLEGSGGADAELAVLPIGSPCDGEHFECDETLICQQGICMSGEWLSCTSDDDCGNALECIGGFCTQNYCEESTCPEDGDSDTVNQPFCHESGTGCVQCRYWADESVGSGEQDCPDEQVCTVRGYCADPIRIPREEPFDESIAEVEALAIATAVCSLETDEHKAGAGSTANAMCGTIVMEEGAQNISEDDVRQSAEAGDFDYLLNEGTIDGWPADDVTEEINVVWKESWTGLDRMYWFAEGDMSSIPADSRYEIVMWMGSRPAYAWTISIDTVDGYFERGHIDDWDEDG